MPIRTILFILTIRLNMIIGILMSVLSARLLSAILSYSEIVKSLVNKSPDSFPKSRSAPSQSQIEDATWVSLHSISSFFVLRYFVF